MYLTFVLLEETTSPQPVEQQFPAIVEEHIGTARGSIASKQRKGETIAQEIPGIAHSINMTYKRKGMVSRNDGQPGKEQFVIFSVPGFFDVFTFPLLRGDAATALQEPNSVVLTEEMARTYFGDEDPLGQTIRINLFEAAQGLHVHQRRRPGRWDGMLYPHRAFCAGRTQLRYLSRKRRSPLLRGRYRS